MRKLFSFLMVGLTFAALNISTVAAQTPNSAAPPTGMPPTMAPPMGEDCNAMPTRAEVDSCRERKHVAAGGTIGMPPMTPPMGANGMPPTGMPPTGMPPTMAPPAGQ